MAAGALAGIVAVLAPYAARAQAPARPSGAVADTLPLALEAAVQLATGRGEQVRLARIQVDIAETQVASARAERFPQLAATLGYQRTLRSPYAGGLSGLNIPRYAPDTTASLAQRVRYLEQNAPTAPFSGIGSLAGGLGLGVPNTYGVEVTGSQTLFSGGRTAAGVRAAEAGRRAAAFTLVEQTADAEQQVRTAYYQASLARDLAAIADSSYAQADWFLTYERQLRSAGRAADLDVLKAEVSRDNLRPQQVQARNQRDVALLTLKQLTHIPLAQSLRLTTPLEVAPAGGAAADDADVAPAVLTAQRSAVRAAASQVAAAEQQLRAARGARLPSVAVQSSFAPTWYAGDVFGNVSAPRTNWTVGFAVQVPLFQGGRLLADVRQAEAQQEQSRLQLSQLERAVQVQYEQARLEQARARAEIAVRRRTVDQARRAYDLTLLRFEQGASTQLDVTSARADLLQARTNLAQAAADYATAGAAVARALAGVSAPPPPAVPSAAPPPR
ncbi:hypothetical protein tb265_46890 [Gemmatimonadetes bacterium T265]|nr:hypothetical protein tb265_46890 [Gemmatimonadetes bacterium T265]